MTATVEVQKVEKSLFITTISGYVNSGPLRVGMKLEIDGKTMTIRTIIKRSRLLKEAHITDYVSITLKNADYHLLKSVINKEVTFRDNYTFDPIIPLVHNVKPAIKSAISYKDKYNRDRTKVKRYTESIQTFIAGMLILWLGILFLVASISAVISGDDLPLTINGVNSPASLANPGPLVVYFVVCFFLIIFGLILLSSSSNFISKMFSGLKKSIKNKAVNIILYYTEKHKISPENKFASILCKVVSVVNSINKYISRAQFYFESHLPTIVGIAFFSAGLIFLFPFILPVILDSEKTITINGVPNTISRDNLSPLIVPIFFSGIFMVLGLSILSIHHRLISKIRIRLRKFRS